MNRIGIGEGWRARQGGKSGRESWEEGGGEELFFCFGQYKITLLDSLEMMCHECTSFMNT